MPVERSLRRLVYMPRPAKRFIVLLVDVALCFVATWLALYLRFGEIVPISGNRWVAVGLALALLPVLWSFGLYRTIFRYLGFEGLLAVARAVLVFGFFYATVFAFLGVADVPRTVGVIQPILAFLLIAASRVSMRSLLGGVDVAMSERRVLIYGAGSAGRQLAAAIAGSGEMHLAGFVDDDPTLHGSTLNGQRIHAIDDLPRIVPARGVTDILLAIPSVTRKRRNEIVDALRPLALTVRTLPGIMEIAHGHVELASLRALDIEDLLGRDPAAPNQILLGKNVTGKTVLVTGAGGSIGSELCRQIVAARADTLILVDSSEFSLYCVDAELRKLASESGLRIVPLLASVCDRDRMRAVMTALKPDTVYHAAAYKHVPLVEHNVVAGVANNVFGTLIAVEEAIAASVSDFVLISTDKAVRPTNVMGASKRLAELVLQALAADSVGTCLSMVRFGNVLGSSGSVVPLFRQQIAAGGPVTITHADVTRFFMTIPEAAQLVIQAGAMASGGEVFILDMGQPVKINDLARKMIELSGATVRDEDDPDGDIELRVTGLRPGEKLYEELLIGNNPRPTTHPLIMKAVEQHVPREVLWRGIERLRIAVAANEICNVHALLKELVVEYAAGEIVDHLDVVEDKRATALATMNFPASSRVRTQST